MKKRMRFKQCWLGGIVVCLLSLSVISMAGCAGRTRTSTVTTQTTTVAPGSGTPNSVTTRTEEVTSSRPHGVIGGFFYTVGQILMIPFRLIGSLF